MEDINDRLLKLINITWSTKGKYPMEIHLGEEEYNELVDYIKRWWSRQPNDYNNLQFGGCKVVKVDLKNYLSAKIIHKETEQNINKTI